LNKFIYGGRDYSTSYLFFNNLIFILIYYNSEYRYISIIQKNNIYKDLIKDIRQKEKDMRNENLEMINAILDDIKNEIEFSNMSRQNPDIIVCILSGIPEIIKLTGMLQNEFNDSIYQKLYAIIDSFISLVEDEFKWIASFKVIRHYLEMYKILR